MLWQAFFRNLKESSTSDGIWFAGIKKQIERLINQRRIVQGDSLDESANELFLHHVRELSRAFARADTGEAASRKLAVKTLWRAAGRAGEPGALTLVWDILVEQFVLEMWFP
jgi:hypothetical protein